MEINSMFLIIKLIYLSVVFHYHQSSPLNRTQRFDDTVDYTGTKVIRVVPQNDKQFEYLVSLQNDLKIQQWLRPTKIGAPVDIMVPPTELENFHHGLDQLNFTKEVMIDDVGNHIKRDEIQFFSSGGSEKPLFNDFQRYEEIQKFLAEKHKENPKITELSKLGKSVEGRDIELIKIGSDLTADNKCIIYIDGGMHAREWAAVSTALYLIDHLIDDFNKDDPEIKTLFDNFIFFIVPVVNPDGYEFTHTKDRMWRKNRGKIPGSECIGIDLNRNYPFHWGGEGSSTDPCDECYAGPEALSEPESKALTEFILSKKDKMKAYITLHSYGQFFLYPWGWTKEHSPNDKELKRVAEIGYKALFAVHQTKYQIGPPSTLLNVAQGSDDWAHGEALIPYVYCLEMRDSGKNGFLLPKDEIIPLGEEVYAGVKAMASDLIDIVHTPGSNVISRTARKGGAKSAKKSAKKAAKKSVKRKAAKKNKKG